MRFPRKRGATSVMVRIFIPDNSSTKGAGLAGLTSSSTNLVIAYMRELDGTATTYTGANIEAQTTIGTYQAPSSSSKIRFKAVDGTNFPGVYELQFHNSATAFGTGDTSRNILINILETSTTALNIGPNGCLISLSAYDIGEGEANAVAMSGTTLTARDIGASVLLSSGSGTGQLDFTSGVVKANLVQILATALTETAGQIAAAFKKFFNVATPTGTVNSIPDAVAGAAGGLFIAGSNAATTVNITGNLSGSVGSVTGAVGSVTGAVGSVTGSVGSVASGGIAAASFAAGAIDATAIATDAIGSAEFSQAAADKVWSTTTRAVTDKAGFSLSSAGIQAIWDALTSALTTVGSIGKLLVDNINATISSRSTYAGADTSGTTTLLSRIASAITITGGKVDVNDKTGFALTSGEEDAIVDKVWDEAIAGHLTAGSTGASLNGAGSAGDPWTTALPGSYGAGTAGKILGDNLNATVSSRAPESGGNVAAIKAKTDNLPASPAAVGSAMTLTSAYDPAKTAAQAGDAMALTSGERTTLAGVVWANATRTLTSFGTLVADVATAVWGAATRTLTAFGFSVTAGTVSDKTGYSLTSGERNAVADAMLDRADAIYTGITPREAIRATLDGAATGQTDGGATTTFHLKSKDGAKTRVTATVDSDGNRSAIIVGDLT